MKRKSVTECETELLKDLLERTHERLRQQDELIAILLTTLSNFTWDREDFNCAYCPAESTCTGLAAQRCQCGDSDYCLLNIILDAYRDIGASPIWRYRDKEIKRALRVWLDNKDLDADSLWDTYCKIIPEEHPTIPVTA